MASHRDMGYAEYRITTTMAGYGTDEDSADALLGAFLSKHPEMGPVVSQDPAADTISVTLRLKAGGLEHALEFGRVVWATGGAASGLEPTRVVRTEIEPGMRTADDQAATGERVPA